MTTEDTNSLLICAAGDGNALEVQRLISLSPSKSITTAALKSATLNGHAECVRLLIPVSDPQADNSEALYLAAQFGYNDCVDLLFDCSDFVGVLNRLKDGYNNKDMYSNTLRKLAKWGYLEDKVCAQQQKARIHQHIDKPSAPHTKKM